MKILQGIRDIITKSDTCQATKNATISMLDLECRPETIVSGRQVMDYLAWGGVCAFQANGSVVRQSNIGPYGESAYYINPTHKYLVKKSVLGYYFVEQ